MCMYFVASLHQTTKYPTAKVTTQQPGVVEGINYYVTPKFRQLYARDRNQLRRVRGRILQELLTFNG